MLTLPPVLIFGATDLAFMERWSTNAASFLPSSQIHGSERMRVGDGDGRGRDITGYTRAANGWIPANPLYAVVPPPPPASEAEGCGMRTTTGRKAAAMWGSDARKRPNSAGLMWN